MPLRSLAQAQIAVLIHTAWTDHLNLYTGIWGKTMPVNL
jgi:hypothetical protein